MMTQLLGCALRILSRENISLLPNNLVGEIHVRKMVALHLLSRTNCCIFMSNFRVFGVDSSIVDSGSFCLIHSILCSLVKLLGGYEI